MKAFHVGARVKVMDRDIVATVTSNTHSEEYPYLLEQDGEPVCWRSRPGTPEPFDGYELELAPVEPAPIKHPRVYISGPMTGYPDHNFPAFNAAAERLATLGYDVVNPADKGIVHHADGTEWSWSEYLRHDIAELVTCDALFTMAGATESKGARLEYHIAKQLGLLIIAEGDRL